MHFLVNAGRTCSGGATLRCSNLLLSPNVFIYGHLLDLNGSVADVKTVVSPDKAKHDIFGFILGIFMTNTGHLCSRGAIL